MKVACLRVSNYRCFGTGSDGKHAFQFAPRGDLNLLIGPNGAGKTAAVQALDLVLNAENRHNRNLVTDFDFHRSDLSRSIVIDVILTHVGAAKAKFASDIQWFDAGNAWEEAQEIDETHHVEGVLIRFQAERDDSTGAIGWRWILPKHTVADAGEERDLTPAQHETIDYYRISPRISDGTFALGEYSPLGRYLSKLGYRLSRLATGPSPYSNCDLDCAHCECGAECVGQNPDGLSFGSCLSEVARQALDYLGGPGGVSPGLGDTRGATRARLAATTVGLRTDLPNHKTGFIPYAYLSAGEKYAFAFALATAALPGQQELSGHPIILVEEPETALYPAAVGRIVSAVKARGSAQVFVTTHSESVLRHFDLSSVFVLSRERQLGNLGRALQSEEVPKEVIDDFQYSVMPGQASALLSDKVLLVEGERDALTSGRLERTADSGKDQKGFLAARGWMAFRCRGSSRVAKYAGILTSLGYRVAALFDGDVNGRKHAEEAKASIPVFCYSSTTVKDPTFEDALLAGLSQPDREAFLAAFMSEGECAGCTAKVQDGQCWKTCPWPKRKADYKDQVAAYALETYGRANSFPPALRRLAELIDTHCAGAIAHLRIEAQPGST